MIPMTGFFLPTPYPSTSATAIPYPPSPPDKPIPAPYTSFCQYDPMAPLFRLSIEPQTARYPLHHHNPSRSRPPERLLPVSGAPSQYAALSIRLARPVGGRRHQADPASRRSLPANHIAGRGRGREGGTGARRRRGGIGVWVTQVRRALRAHNAPQSIPRP